MQEGLGRHSADYYLESLKFENVSILWPPSNKTPRCCTLTGGERGCQLEKIKQKLRKMRHTLCDASFLGSRTLTRKRRKGLFLLGMWGSRPLGFASVWRGAMARPGLERQSMQVVYSQENICLDSRPLCYINCFSAPELNSLKILFLGGKCLDINS